MTIVRCPRCRDEVTAPAKAAPQALVRCPLCLEEYLLSAALAGVPPALIVVGGEAHDSASSNETGDDYRLSGGGFPGVFDASAPSEAAAIPARPTVTTAQRPKKQEKSAAVELVKIVLGGVVGLAIGLVVLWWVFGRDPLELGPQVANYAPWLVPAEFHGKSKTADTEAAAAPAKPRKAGKPKTDEAQVTAEAGGELKRLPTSPDTPALDSGLIDAPLPGGLGGKPLDPILDIPLDLPKPAAATQELPPLELPPAGTPAPTPNAAADVLSAPAAPMPDLTDLLPDNTPPAELAPGDARPVPSAAALTQAVGAATEAMAKYEGLPKEDAEARRGAFTALYDATGEVGRILSFLNPLDAPVSEEIARLQDLLDTLSGAKGSSKLNPVKFLASQRWSSARPEDGFLVAGTVKEIQPAGRLFAITLDASSRAELIVPILTPSPPEEIAAVGDVLVVVGRVLDEPLKNLPDYEGTHTRVVLLGHAVRAPKLE